MHFICRSFIGSHDSSGWSQYWENEPDDPLIINQKGHLFGLIDLSSKENSDLNSIGHEIISAVNRHYFYDNQNDIAASLKSLLFLVFQNPLYSNIEISLMLAVAVNNKVYFGILGPGEIIFNRSNRISKVLSGKKNNFFVLSGPILSGDQIFLSTSLFYEKFSWEKIKSFLIDENIQNIEENFLSILYSFDDQTGLSAAFIRTESDDIENNENIESISKQSTNSNIKPLQKKISFPKINFSFVKKILVKKPVYVSHIESVQVLRRKKINLIIGIILLLSLGVSSFLGYKKSQSSRLESQYQQLKEDLDKKISDAVAVKSLNFDSAIELANQSKDIYEKLVSLKIHSDELPVYWEKIESLLSKTGVVNSLTQNVFYDTSLIVNNPKFSKILLKNNSLYLLDSSSGRLDLIDIGQKNTKNISINEKIKSVLSFAENNSNFYLVDDKAISLVDKNGVEVKIDLSKMDKNVSQIDTKSWNGAFYLLDSQNSTIWKFNPNASGFGSGEIWLKDDQKLDNPSSLAINGNIWVLSKNGKITSFVRGSKDSFKQSQIPQINNAKSLVVGADNGLLAFSSDDNLVYVYKKTGDLSAKYNFDGKKIQDIAMDEKTNSLFVLSDDQKIYKISL